MYISVTFVISERPGNSELIIENLGHLVSSIEVFQQRNLSSNMHICEVEKIIFVK